MRERNSEDPRDRGYLDYYDDKGLYDNPYHETAEPASYLEWELGWNEAEQEECGYQEDYWEEDDDYDLYDDEEYF